MKICGVGVAIPEGSIRQLGLCFSVEVCYSRDELRIMLINLSQEFLDQITENVEIQHYLENPPFTLHDVRIMIYEYQKDEKKSEPKNSIAEITNKILTYRSIDSEDNSRYKIELEETYQEALEKIKQMI